MNDKFDELAKGMAQSVTRALLCLAMAAQLAVPAHADNFKVGPLIEVSKNPDPLAGNNRAVDAAAGGMPVVIRLHSDQLPV